LKIAETCRDDRIIAAILPTMPKHPKLTTEPTTASNRLTPQEIDALREGAHRMDAEMQAILDARKRQAEAK
jgi:DNA-binding transcriptional regulator YiaG